MKKLLLFALVATFAIVSCTKDDEERTYSADVTLNGTKTTIPNLIFYSNGESVTIDSEDENNEIYIYLEDPEVGNITFGESNGVELTINGKRYSSETGSFTIIESTDSAISGNFNGKFKESGSTSTVTISGSFTAQKKNPFLVDLED